jgi:uncharacterized membrane protein
MNPNDFLHRLDESAVIAAIEAAERLTSGEIRVYVSKNEVTDSLERAAYRFKFLEMHNTRERNGVLIYFAPRSQKFAVIGDIGIHAKCGQSFWDEVAASIRTNLREQHFTEAVILAVRKVGELLAQHFPPRPDDQNELPNSIELGPG